MIVDELAIVRRVCQGDTRAFEALVLRYQRPLFHYLGRLAFEKAVIEELVQETFIRAYQNLDRYDPDKGASFATWLFTIARHLALNEQSRAGRRYETQYPPELLDKADNNLSPAESVELAERQAALYNALSHLPMPFRSAVSLAYLEELSLDEIAKIEGCAVGTVKSRIFRGKMKLKALLSKALGVDE
jgi:RNA polymerase sigma-70 factor (ECF subfamily)